MNTKFIATGAALVGAGAGAIVAWAITADRADQRSRAMRDELRRMEKALREKMSYNSHLEIENEQLNVRVDELEQKLYSNDENSPGETVDEIVSPEAIDVIPEGETPDETKAKLHSQIKELVGDYQSNPDVASRFAEEATRIVVESSRQEPPFVISQTEYASDLDDEGAEYDKKTFTFYEKHRVLLDEDDEVVPQRDIENMVGWRNLSRFGDQSNDADTVFVRNRRLDMDFEVVRELDEEPPLYVKLGMDKESYEANRSAGRLKFREEDV
jgi:hypothetical protein